MKHLSKVFTLLLLLLVSALPLSAQMISGVVKWNIALTNQADGSAELKLTAKMEPKWHLYDQNLPKGGPTSTTFTLTGKGFKVVGQPVANKKPVESYDANFDMTLRWFEEEVTFTQKLQISDPKNFALNGEIEYMACNDQTCLPPDREEFSLLETDIKTPITAAAPQAPTTAQEEVAEVEVPATTNEAEPATTDTISQQAIAYTPIQTNGELADSPLWTPVVEKLKGHGDATLSAVDASLWKIFLYGFLGGLIALMTPCVWPMIPMTVSFFLKRTKARSKAIRDAVTYGISIIVIYLALGLIITGIFGASALNSLATNAVFNIIFFLLLVFFAISFFGAFELVLPQSWTNKLDSKADSTTGILSIFFMAFTLALVSFSCTGPIIGTLLVSAATIGSKIGPAIGMFGFALALSIPFSFFAIFPNYLQSMPKSGGWLNSVKVVLGFLELALALKFLSVADLAYGWRILDREVFVALWIIIFALLGLYLMGKIRFDKDSPTDHVSVPRLFMSIISLSFAVYMVPGLWGAPLKAISAFAPPLYTQDFNLYDAEVHAKFDDYESAIEYARKHNKPIMIDFSGYGCVNCRKMEAAVWTDPKVKHRLENDVVLVTLMVDDKTSLPQPIEVNINGKKKTLKTIGDKWSYLQSHKFGSNAQPFYVVIDGNGEPLGPSYGYKEDVPEYLKFIDSAVKRFKEQSANK